MQEDLEEMFEDMNEITESLGRNVGQQEFLDDADLEAELACLEDELDLEESGPTELPSYLMPEAPKVEPVAEGEAAPAQAEVAPVDAAPELDAYGLPSK
jgi:charged multivesicular body protein 5